MACELIWWLEFRRVLFRSQVQAARKDLMFRRNPNKQLLMEKLLSDWYSLPRAN